LKERRPELVINLMGCLVGVRGDGRLRQAFPYVDVFSPPSDPGPLVEHLSRLDGREHVRTETVLRNAILDEDLLLPEGERGSTVSAFVPVVYGCSHGCTFCVIPSRRGPERSRPVGEIVAEGRSLVAQGVREITLLGQIVDRYGRDIPDGPRLADLLRVLHQVDGLERIRFLTSHPNWMTDELLEAVASLPKVCEHIEVPVQAGDDDVLRRMKRGYTVDDYRRLIGRIREKLPGGSIATDIIVGFPGETDGQFERTRALLAELRLDVAHLARYSPRPGTLAARRMPDDVPEAEKDRRFRALEDLQEGIAAEINSGSLGREVEILVEENHRGRWKGRTRTNKLVFFDARPGENLAGRLARVRITWAGPWSLIGEPAATQPAATRAAGSRPDLQPSPPSI
jgi:tRNA-2-methylthio-N6-dimethylallyladenosine synthase